MKVLKVLLCLSVMFIVSSTVPIEAHPGRTDGNGCHVCRTNCSNWGLQQGEYHCHNGGNSSSNSSAPAPATPAPVVEVYTPPVIDYKAIGNSDGYAFKKNNPNATLSEANYTYEDGNYREEYKNAFQQAEKELRDNSMKLASERGRADSLLYMTYNFDNEPIDIIKNIYEENYKTEFDEAVLEVKTELTRSADTNAYEKAYNNKTTTEVVDYNLETYKEYYNKEYISYSEKYKAEKSKWLKTAKKQGKNDKENGDEKGYVFMEEVADTKFYEELKNVYDTSYENAENSNGSILLIPIVIWIIVACISLVFTIKKQKKYHNMLRTNH